MDLLTLTVPSGATENIFQEEELCLKFDEFFPLLISGVKKSFVLHTLILFLSSKVSLLSIVSVKQKHDNPFSASESSSRMLMLSKSSLK